MGKGKPLPGDRAAWDAKDYPLVHANDIDTLDGIHHTLGTDATQAAPGNHVHDDRYYTESETDTLLGGKSDTTHTHSHFTDTANPHSVTKDQVGLGNVANLKCNLAATAAPTASDDSADGYAVGSSWFDVTNDKAYLCLDATADAAVWQELGAEGLSYAANDISNPPTDAELDAIFGTPATVGAVFMRILNDNGAGSNVYVIGSDGTNWWYLAMTKAT